MVAKLRPGETSCTLAPAAASTCCCQPAGSHRTASPTAWTPAPTCSPSLAPTPRRRTSTNARFLHGRIENIPLPDDHVDVIISNCVINLSGDKPAVLAEAFRVLKPGGRLGISDVTAGENTDPARLARTEQQVGCVAGALTRPEYVHLLVSAGFTDVTTFEEALMPQLLGDLRATAGRKPRRPRRTRSL